MSTMGPDVHRRRERDVLYRTLMVLAVACSIVGCTKKTTVYETSDAAGQTANAEPGSGLLDNAGPGTSADGADGAPDAAAADPDGVPVPPAFSDQPVNPSAAEPAGSQAPVAPTLPEAGVDAVVGQPGVAVDCEQRLPCRWSDSDESFAVSVTSADDTGPRNGLSISFQVDATHDTELVFGGGSDVVVDTGARPAAIARALGDGNGLSPVATEAGSPASGRIDYAAPAGSALLTRWRIGLSDNGQVREAIFVNVPVGPAASAAVDCALTLPCIWSAPDNSASVRLDAAGGLADVRRLSVGFTVVSGTALAVALDGGSAIGADGSAFQSRNVTLGDSTAHTSVHATTVANLNLGGSIDFRRVDGNPYSLTQLSLSLYPDAPVPRWQMIFENVPLL